MPHQSYDYKNIKVDEAIGFGRVTYKNVGGGYFQDQGWLKDNSIKKKSSKH